MRNYTIKIEGKDTGGFVVMVSDSRDENINTVILKSDDVYGDGESTLINSLNLNLKRVFPDYEPIIR